MITESRGKFGASRELEGSVSVARRGADGFALLTGQLPHEVRIFDLKAAHNAEQPAVANALRLGYVLRVAPNMCPSQTPPRRCEPP